jgi:hypothetical protein
MDLLMAQLWKTGQLSYYDLEPCYEKAEWEIGVAGEHNANPFFAPRKKPYPMPPFSYNREGNLLSDAAKRLGFAPLPNSNVA